MTLVTCMIPTSQVVRQVNGSERDRTQRVRAAPLLGLALAPRRPVAARVVDANMATLWQLLILFCFAATVGGALASAKLAKVGFGGYALAVTIGLPLGVCCAWAMWIMHKIFVTNLRRRPDWEHWASQHEWFYVAFYFTKILWIVFAAFLGRWVSSAILRLVF